MAVAFKGAAALAAVRCTGCGRTERVEPGRPMSCGCKKAAVELKVIDELPEKK